MLTCFGLCGSDFDESEREPLLPQYHDATSRVAVLHEKLHTYQMLRAMSQGYMPSNHQTIIHLRTLLSAAILNPADSTYLSPSGRALVRTTKLWLQQLMDLLENKNSRDQIQDFAWYMSKARFGVSARTLTSSVTQGKTRANVAAAVESLRTVLSLLLLNKDFRVFLADIATIAKQVLRDSAMALGDASKEAGAKLDDPTGDMEALKKTDATEQPSESVEDVKQKTVDVVQTAFQEVTHVGEETYSSFKEHMSPESRQVLAKRLKKAVGNLRQRPDYSESASTLASILQRYLEIYLAAGSEAAHTVEDSLQPNRHAHQAAHNFWLFVSSFGNEDEWQSAHRSLSRFMENHKADEHLHEFVGEFATLVQRMLSDPTFFDHVEDHLDELRRRINALTSGSSLGDDATDFLNSLQKAVRSIPDDENIHKMAATTLRLIHIVSPAGEFDNSDLIDDLINVFVPLLVQAVQYIPIPRLEVSTPAIDLLLENVILQPGETINNSSFLPFSLQFSTRNDVDITKARFGTRSTVTSLATIKIAGLSVAANDVGYWMRLHSGLFRLTDAGISSFHLDERGIDITFDVEFGKDRLEELVTLRNVKVKIHHLDYKLRKSKLTCLAWILKPVIRPIIRKTLESQISSAIEDGMRALNRELVYARERLRATRICNPSDMLTFIRATIARLVPPPDPDVQARIGVQPGDGVFKGRYAPGSLVKLWEEEGRGAEQAVFEYKQDGWRNGIFDVATVPAR